MDVPVACRCGEFEGTLLGVEPSNSNRLVCYCDDCQCYAHHLGADTILDARGGTALYQMSPKRLQITRGADQLAAVRLSPKGLVRWYTRCCSTPVANTVLKPRLPFIGVVHNVVQLDEAGLDAAFGPAGRVAQTRFATGGPEGLGETRGSTVGVLLRMGRLLGGWWLAGDAARDPLFPGGHPRTEPTVLGKDEREALRGKVGSASA